MGNCCAKTDEAADMKTLDEKETVKFDKFAREWRCKYSNDNGRQSLTEAQAVLTKFLGEINNVPEVRGVQRIVCTAEREFKVIISLHHSAYQTWEAKKFQPEEAFIAALKAIKGVDQVETQKMTLMPVFSCAAKKVALQDLDDKKTVQFDTFAREWRCKWSHDNGRQALTDAQALLTKFVGELKKVPDVKSVQRIVCTIDSDFKVIVAVSRTAYSDWEAKQFEPEKAFIAELKAIPGISKVETQKYTIMPVALPDGAVIEATKQ
uniref:Uncharacterized protein n=1 Tax=Pyrodinium bahamense TaxID=73915 RepID=A0A7S0AID6_9DINO|mmetsp:Transcript_34949/g.96649  ORF Transcript_34949/g.96649 Transcript_34949/m.96649 type:complete len:264 (+) Transcript_34949:101-892(+)|eukprot:CAMPEP_0179154220 /NCGR_PEP_ID=MMETSP0796-20121207/75039_1 /TAXON_ID=73915 /ORGANISM="Pyrodinium bahamense, Strain pbaha01" /LENGTH=263 /DNA_ID=CAMNT_0020855567 /DNA_START=88 /DNA_END=879 /DNA_ORIENTATION=+